MKPLESTIVTTNTMEGEEIEFTIGDPRWVMRSMSKLYSNRELAVVREYSTNARDAMIEADRADHPIIVTLPDQFNPFFTVQDTGVGMSRGDLKSVYTVFGNSTKRDSDDFNGMLGFGCKSALAYTHTFRIEAIKNGRKTGAVVTRNKDFSITMKILFEMDSLEPNGVTVQVPVHNHAEFATKARDFYRYWIPGTVLVNGQTPEWAVGEKINDDLYYNAQQGTSFVVMGNVPYRITNPDALFKPGMKRISFVAYVENGAVEFVPSREDLEYTDHTRKALQQIINDFCDKAIDKAKDEIDNAPSHWQAYQNWTKWRTVIGAQNVPELFYKGDKLVDYVKVDGWQYYNRSYGGGSTYSVKEWPIQQLETTMFVTEFGATSLASYHKKQLREWKQNSIAADPTLSSKLGYFIVTDGTIDSPWVDPSKIIKWEDLKAALPKKAPTPRVKSTLPGRKAGTFDLLTKDGYKSEQDVPIVKDLYYTTVQEYNDGGKELEVILKNFNMDDKVVKVPANRLNKFLRFYPHAQKIMPVLEAMVNFNGKSLLSPEAIKLLDVETYEARRLSMLDHKKIDDPDLAEIVRLAQIGEFKLLTDYNKQRSLALTLNMGSKFQSYKKVHSSWDRNGLPLTKAYPLASNINTVEIEHVYYYLNAVYHARQQGVQV